MNIMGYANNEKEMLKLSTSFMENPDLLYPARIKESSIIAIVDIDSLFNER